MKIPRILLAGTGSGCGKTTFVCAVTAALARLRSIKVQPFKCGPDYIDPMFHRQVTGRFSGNLDPFMLPAQTLRYLLQKRASDADISVIEGVMGYYDGLGTTCAFGTSDVAAITKTPVLLVLNAQGMSASLAAVAKGFADFRPENGIAGILLNGVSERLYSSLKIMLHKETRLEVFGYLPKIGDCSLKNRHLGLVTAAEVTDLEDKIRLLAHQAERTVDLDRIQSLADSAPPMPEEASPFAALEYMSSPFRLGVAMDEAFCFYYPDALDLLEETGAEIVRFSPLNDATLPDSLDGLYLGGGYPEIHAPRLSANRSMLEDIRRQVTDGLPTFAECGGFMLLCRNIRVGGDVWPMSGVLDSETFMTDRLVRFGYVELMGRREGLLTPEGWTGRGHEFHYSDGTKCGDAFTVSKPDGRSWESIHAHPTLHAGYPHLHLYSDPRLAVNFARACVRRRDEKS